MPAERNGLCGQVDERTGKRATRRTKSRTNKQPGGWPARWMSGQASGRPGGQRAGRMSGRTERRPMPGTQNRARSSSGIAVAASFCVKSKEDALSRCRCNYHRTVRQKRNDRPINFRTRGVWLPAPAGEPLRGVGSQFGRKNSRPALFFRKLSEKRRRICRFFD